MYGSSKVKIHLENAFLFYKYYKYFLSNTRDNISNFLNM
jgi:hypothetical protein